MHLQGLTLHPSTGTLRYGKTNLVLDVDQEIVRYYRSLLPKWIDTDPQRYRAHISVVRHEEPPNMDVWGKHEGERIEFWYTHQVYSGRVYYWINAFCERLEEIRLELGLPVSSPYTRPPSDQWIKCFHITLGNQKRQLGEL